MKFETINGALCRMVEPEPIFGSTKAPFVIMGKNTKHPTIITQDMDVLLRIFLVAYSDEFEIIGYPVVDGSAEWALYQMMHGKWVHNPELEKHKTETTDTRCLHAYAISGDNVIVKNIVTGETSVLGTARPDNVIVYFETTGWQLYEPQPEPKPAYAVGDDVEVNVNGEMKQGKLVRFCSADFMQDNTDAFVLHDFFGRWYGYHRVADIIRKLDPSEVVVAIGCLSGTVRQCGDKEEELFALHTKNNAAVIPLAMLDEPMQTLIKDLLQKQEGDAK